MTSQPIEIVLTGTANYFPNIAVVARSVLENTTNSVRFHVLYAYNKERHYLRDIESLRKMVKEFPNAEIQFYDVEDKMKMFQGMPRGKWATWNKTYYSHYIYWVAPLVLPASIGKIIYMDADMICNADIAAAWKIDMRNKSLATAQPSGIEPQSGDEFNSGFLIMNLDRWRKYDLLQRLLDFGIETLDVEHFGSDQRILNMYFRLRNPDELMYVDVGWNKYTPKDDVAGAFVCHFIIEMEPKPWFRQSDRPMHKLWWDVAGRTPFYDRFISNLKKYRKNDPLMSRILRHFLSLFILNKDKRFQFREYDSRKNYNIAESMPTCRHDDAKHKNKVCLSDRNFAEQMKSLAKQDCYNLILHRNLGDVFYMLGTKEKFENIYENKLRFIVRPQHEFLMQMFGITDYSVYDLDDFCPQKDYVEKYLPVVPFFPVLGKAFVSEDKLRNMYDIKDMYLCFRWAQNMGIHENFRFRIPSFVPTLSKEAEKVLAKIAPLDKIVLFAPEAATAVEFPPEFWNIIAERVHAHGYKIIVNSQKYPIQHGISAMDLGLSLSDIVALGLSCAYVFSLRSGLCDVLVGAKDRLYVFYSNHIGCEMGSLRHPFSEKTKVNEILVRNWTIDDFQWEGENLAVPLQKQLNFWHGKLRRYQFKLRFFPMDREVRDRHNFICQWFQLFAGDKSVAFPDKDKTLFYRDISFLPFYSKKHQLMPNEHLKITKTFLFGILKRTKTEFGNRFLHIFGIPVASKRPYKAPLKELMSQIDEKYDDIYILRHNIGETYIELGHLANRTKENGSKRPLLILWNEKFIHLYRMFLPEKIDMIYIKLPHFFVHEFFDDKPKVIGKQRLFCIAPFIVNNMRTLEKEQPDINFYTHLVDCMGIERGAKMAVPCVSNHANSYIDKIIETMKLKKKFVIFITEANSLNAVPDRIWNKLAEQLLRKGYDIFLNQANREITGAKKTDLNIEELYVLAQRSAGVITIANGLALLLTSANRKMDLIYTSHHRWHEYSAKWVMKHYSAYHIPRVDKNLVKEHDADNVLEQELLENILKRY